MKPFRWNAQKNRRLISDRGVSFERIVVAIENGGLVDVLAHRNQEKCPGQRVMIVLDDYAFLVPYIEDDEHLFLKTIIPSRKATRDYPRSDENEVKNDAEA